MCFTLKQFWWNSFNDQDRKHCTFHISFFAQTLTLSFLSTSQCTMPIKFLENLLFQTIFMADNALCLYKKQNEVLDINHFTDTNFMYEVTSCTLGLKCLMVEKNTWDILCLLLEKRIKSRRAINCYLWMANSCYYHFS